ncbi:HpcH/HpaI aldolase/citrate lyase family protein [Sphingomonas abietis]|uniref:CoA ester lyase n=1 Tax=Sphingomonas abietis TaxID=3012344 RepID=A0ABY7NU92_9SPHN|nr:CoA ester lyase [Sphingomonas abietis]WBO24142.1 CoA ester lyase [Sphingomonas abietis]
MIAPRSALFLPASNPRAVAKARTLDVDMVILDLEDAVADDAKAAARQAAIAAVDEPFGGAIVAIRLNAPDTEWHIDDIVALSASRADLVVVPKVEDAVVAAKIAAAVGRPVYAMIETPAGLLAAAGIAAAHGVAGLIAGTNDLAHSLRLPERGRIGLSLALQTIVLAARAAGIVALDGVWNRLDDGDGLAAECAEGRALGFDGKTLIHPNQIAAAHAGFGPSEAEIEDARALVAAATTGAARFRGRMVEAMHVASARSILARASGKATDPLL